MSAHDLPPLVIDYRGHLLAGVDEVGRGPLIGAVVAAAVILDPLRAIEGLADSKKLTPQRREALDGEIRERALAFAVAEASAAEIDALHHAFHLLLSSRLNTTQAVERIREEISGSPEVTDLLRFIEGSSRGVTK